MRIPRLTAKATRESGQALPMPLVPRPLIPCGQALEAFRALRVVAAAAGAACLLGLAAALGGGAALAARAPVALIAGAALAAACFVWFGRLAQTYIYMGWDHASNH